MPLIGEKRKIFDNLLKGIQTGIDKSKEGHVDSDGNIEIAEWNNWQFSVQHIYDDQDRGFPEIRRISDMLRAHYGRTFDVQLIIINPLFGKKRMKAFINTKKGKGRLFLIYKRYKYNLIRQEINIIF